MLAFQTTSMFMNTPTRHQHPRGSIPKTWHLATLAPGFDGSRLQFPIYVATNDSSEKIYVSSYLELDSLLAKYRDDGSPKSSISPSSSSSSSSSPPRSDSATGSLNLNPRRQHRTDINGISIISSSANPVDEEHDTPLSEHFVNGEIVCTGGLTLESRDLTQIEDEARDVVFRRGRSVSMAVRRRYRKKTTRVQKVKIFVSSFFKHLRGLRWSG